MEKLGPGDPQRIGAYRLLARLGAGGMGQVYLARSDRGRTVAVKLVREELAAQDEFRGRFRQEVGAARRVGGAWTAPVLDADTEASIPWVATGYVAGPSLQAVVSHDHGPLPERSVNILAAGLANALKDIHAAGLIHRDLKPSNVLVTIDGPRVIDFGIARALETVTDGGLTRTGALVGSPGFMAPEQVRGDRVTEACDIFCLGSVLAYAATGALPFGTANSGVHALMFRIAQEEPDLEALPESLRDLVGHCLSKAPEDRPSLDEILARTGAEDTLSEGKSLEPWLPAALVAQLGRHAVQLLEIEEPEGAAAAGGAAGSGESAPGESGAAGTAGAGAAAAGAAGASAQGAPDAPAAPPSGQDTPSGHDTPPPPGTPGQASVNHLPTMVSGLPPAPAAAPTPTPGHTPTPAHSPAYAYPHQASGYGYPHPQQPPYGATPPYGPTPPYGLPAGEPQRRSGRSTALLVAVALIVALGAGGTVYATMKGDDGDPKARGGGDGKNRESSAPETPGSPSESDSGPSPSPSTSAVSDKTVPDKFLGTWNGTVSGDAGLSTRRLTIQQGKEGDTVLSMTADGPLEGGGTYHCVFQGELRSASEDRLNIGPTRVTVGGPPACAPGKPTVVTILPSGELHRVNADGTRALTYTKGS
ncbi:serine/threonine-protein kinase [Streptomyces flavofungini]|uniref:serine/threonine-protein kinase n=1 Tax=Streptomyces flavofungini TaxID=68200 RepID=UPI0025B11E86|nr:serine/threonine-protein kinase [Streptomyces flavofungini]WJV51329.1 serine/threonine-protein kinase [Streptomyces flavofungini]